MNFFLTCMKKRSEGKRKKEKEKRRTNGKTKIEEDV